MHAQIRLQYAWFQVMERLLTQKTLFSTRDAIGGFMEGKFYFGFRRESAEVWLVKLRRNEVMKLYIISLIHLHQTKH